MANDLTNISVPRNEWIDLYAASGVTVGTPLFIENVGWGDIYLAVQATKPQPDHDAFAVIKRSDDIFYMNSTGDAGAWAFCQAGPGLLRISASAPNGFGRTVRMLLSDGYGNPISSLRGAINIHDSDPHRIIYNQFLHFDTTTTTTLSVAAEIGATQITLTSAVGFAVADQLKIENGGQEPTFPRIRTLVGNIAALDRPLSLAHTVGADVTKVYTNIAQAGLTTTASVASPVIFTSHIPLGTVVHVTGMSIVMTDNSAMDFTTFGGAAALLNGCIPSAYSNGVFGAYTNWKNNLDISSDSFPVEYQTKVGGGEYGLSAIYNIKQSTESVIYLNGSLNDRFQIIIQDDLTALTTFRIKLQGHYEGL